MEVLEYRQKCDVEPSTFPDSTNFINYIIKLNANLRFGGWKLYRLDFRLQFPPIKTRIGRVIEFFVATGKEACFATHSKLTATKTPFQTRWLRKPPFKLDGYEKSL